MEYELLRENKDGLFERTGEPVPGDMDLEAAAQHCLELRRALNARFALAISERQRRPSTKPTAEAEKPPVKTSRAADAE